MPPDRSPYGGLVMFAPPSRHRRLARRRLVVISAILAIAAAGWLFGALSTPPAPQARMLSPFSSS